jgi:hypothetical protein
MLQTAVLLYLEGLSARTVSRRAIEQQVVELRGAMHFEPTHGNMRDARPGDASPETDNEHDSHCHHGNVPAPHDWHWNSLTPERS